MLTRKIRVSNIAIGVVILIIVFFILHQFKKSSEISNKPLTENHIHEQLSENYDLLPIHTYVNHLNVNVKRRGDSLDPQITEYELWKSLNLFWHFLDVCEKHRIKVVMYGGTLLGSYRHHGVIPWDDDLDVFIDVKDQAVLENALRNDQTLSYLKDKLWKVWNPSSSFRIPRRSWRWPFIDVFFYNVTGSTVYDISALYPPLSYPKSLMFPLHRRPFMGKWLLAPRDTLRFLGYDKTPSDKCISSHYSHKHESGSTLKKMSMRCEDLKDRFPFVIRRMHNYKSFSDNDGGSDGVLEILKFRNITLSSVRVAEPKNASNHDFTTLLIN